MSEAILATFADVKFIRTRSTMQLVLELPIEQADEALKALGGVPQPGTERWVGVALAPKERKESAKIALEKHLDENREGLSGITDTIRGETAKPHRPFNSLPLSQQAGIRCNDGQFHDFLCIREDTPDIPEEQVPDLVRAICLISSRAQLDTNDICAQKWRKLEEEFQAYLTDLRYAGTARL
jgi:hypothetical protein